jgi:hypothetical protein
MTTETDPMRRLAAADPARDLKPAPDAQLLSQTVGEPRTGASPGRVRVRRFTLATTAAIASAVAVAALLASTGDRAPGRGGLALAAQAYALTSPEADQILYTRATTLSERTSPSGTLEREAGSLEEWHRGRETHRIERYGARTALDHVIDAEGVMRQITDDGGYRIIQPTDNEDSATVIDQEQDGFVQHFRERYEQGRLDPAGEVQFAGRPARRYLVEPTPAAGSEQPPRPLRPELAFYVDRETGRPLGYTSELDLGDGTFRYELVVHEIEQLPATEENLAKLRTHSLPRRRDAEGCIRGPVTGARPADTAPKRDCGGTPGAVVPD